MVFDDEDYDNDSEISSVCVSLFLSLCPGGFCHPRC